MYVSESNYQMKRLKQIPILNPKVAVKTQYMFTNATISHTTFYCHQNSL